MNTAGGPGAANSESGRPRGRDTEKKKTPAAPWRGGPAWSRWVGRFLAVVVWSTRVVGADRVPASGPVVFAANHASLVDGPFVLGVAPRPLHMLVKAEAFRGPLGWLLRAAGQIPVDRAVGRQALQTGLAILRRGGAVGVFPEGARGRGDASSARAGAAWLALTGEAPLVPVAVLGSRRPGDGPNHLPGLRRRMVIEFGDPIVITRAPKVPAREALAAANERLRGALALLVEDAAQRHGIPLA